MRVLMINVVCGIRSTGRICTDIAVELEKQGHEVKIAYGREHVPVEYQKYAVKIGNSFDITIHGVCSRLFDACGWGSRSATYRFITWVRSYNPDIIHIHNLHGYYINIEVLFNYLKSCKKKIIWTLHDCWPVTGHAAFCESAGCCRWKTGCYDCPKILDYPKSLFDRSERNWRWKKTILSNIPSLELVTPSLWLANIVKESYLSAYPIKVIYNGIDTDVFIPHVSNINKRLGIENKKIVLGVAALWESRKGLDDFVKLSNLLNDEYCIVLVGLSQTQIRTLPSKIIGIERTESVKELSDLYSAATVFLNLTYEDNYPTTNLEAISCGTPVITYDTGGSGESALRGGLVVPKGDISAVKEAILRINGRVNPVCEFGIHRFVDEYINTYLSSELT